MGILFMGDNCMNKEYITKISKKYEMKMTRYAYNKYVIQDDEKELATN